MIVQAMAGQKHDFDGQAVLLDVKDGEAPPGLLRVHDLLFYLFYIGLDIAALPFVRNQDAVPAGGHHHIFAAHTENRDVQLVHHMGILTGIVQGGTADGLIRHSFGESIPGAQILPLAPVAQNLYFLLPLRHGIVEADFVHLPVTFIEILIILKPKSLVGLFQQIPQPEREHAAVPESPPGDIFLGLL